LSRKQVLSLLDFIVPFKCIPEEIENARIDRIKENMILQFSNCSLYIEILTELKELLKKMYFKSLIQAGESIGTLSATYLGELQTQLILNSFHFSGLSTFSIRLGVPRMLEIMDLTKNMKQTISSIVFKPNFSIEDKYRISKTLKEVYLGELLCSPPDVQYFRKLSKSESKWYNIYYDLYCSYVRDNEDDLGWSIRLQFDKNKLYEYQLSLYQIANRIEIFRDLYCVFSPDNIGIIDVYPDTSLAQVPSDPDMSHINEDNKVYFYIQSTIIPYLENFKIQGIDNIKEIHFQKDGPNWIIQSEGSNLLELFAHSDLDYTQIITNDIRETYRVLGIEAARILIIRELTNITKSSGFIVPCHIQTLADSMTHYGKLTSVSRHGTDIETDPLAMASNETPFDILINSIGKKDDGRCISSSIILGKLSETIGTGCFDLILDNDKLLKGDKVTYNLLECLDRKFKTPKKKPILKKSPSIKSSISSSPKSTRSSPFSSPRKISVKTDIDSDFSPDSSPMSSKKSSVKKQAKKSVFKTKGVVEKPNFFSELLKTQKK
jgi:DNA-directed RNA polymerase II subunit RPB1